MKKHITKFTEMLVVGICLALLMDCSSVLTYRDASKDVQPLVEKYIKVGEKFNNPKFVKGLKELKFYFDSKMPANNYGACYDALNEITLNPKEWDKMAPENKDELFLHEVGHCALGYPHTDTGIMRSWGLYNPEYYKFNYDILLNQFFKTKPGKFISIQYKEKPVTKTDILNNEHAVVRFTATWCPPCKVLAPIFDEVAARYPDVKVYVIDVDKYPELTNEFGIKGIPTLLKIKNGKIELVKSGALPKEEVEEFFK